MPEEGHYHFNVSIVTRGSGDNAIRSAAYRAGERLKDHRTGKVYDRSDRTHEIIHTEIMAPKGAPEWATDREQLWNEVESKEDGSTRRRDAQLAREIDIAIPHQLPERERIALIRRFVREQFVSKGMIADVAWHAPPEHGDDRNFHAHIMLTMREIKGKGFGNKGRNWNSDMLIRHWRKQWAVYANRALERAGLDIRLDHRTLEEQGLDREPTTHDGPAKTDKKRRQKQQAAKTKLEAVTEELDEPDVDSARPEPERRAEPVAQPEDRPDQYPAERHRRKPPLEELFEAHDRVMIYRRMEQHARVAGERQRDARRALSKLDWQAEQEERRIAGHEKRFEQALQDAFENPDQARENWNAHADNWTLGEVLEGRPPMERWRVIASHLRHGPQYGPEAIGRLRGFSFLGVKSKKRVEAERAFHELRRNWQSQRQTRARMEQIESRRAVARAQFDEARQTYDFARDKLGNHRQRSEMRQDLYGRRAWALRNVASSDIWESPLPDEQKHELAGEWERFNVRSAERAAERDSVTAPEKRQPWEPLFKEEQEAERRKQERKRAREAELSQEELEDERKRGSWADFDAADQRDSDQLSRLFGPKKTRRRGFSRER